MVPHGVGPQAQAKGRKAGKHAKARSGWPFRKREACSSTREALR